MRKHETRWPGCISPAFLFPPYQNLTAGVDNGGRSSSATIARGLKPSSRNAVGRQQGLGMTRQNPRSSSEAIARRARRGFSLIEAAIVLGVVGAVIGTIWVSAANMRENYKINKLTDGLILGVNNLQKNISANEAAAMPRDVNGYAFLVNYCVAAKVFPNDFYNGNKIITPFPASNSPGFMYANGGDINCTIFGQTGTDYIEIEVFVPTKSVCLKLTSAITSRFHDNTSLASLIVYEYDSEVNTGTKTVWPLSISGTHCSGLKYPVNIRLRFKFLVVN